MKGTSEKGTSSIYKDGNEISHFEKQEANDKRQGRSSVYDALVVDANLRQSLMTVRSLGHHNLRVAALETVVSVNKSKYIPTFTSRWCQASYIAPSYAEDTAAFLAYLDNILRNTRVQVLISSSDGTIATLRKHREEIERRGVRIALAKEPALALAINKVQTLAIAERLGLGIPRGVSVTSVSEVAAAIREIGLPAVIKPTESWGDGQHRRLLCQLVTTPEEARVAVEALTQGGGHVLFQQFLSGRQESVSLFYTDKEIRARFAQWTMRAQPPLGGVSTYRQSIEMPYDSGAQAERLVREIELEGYSQVQFRRDKAGKPYLMEINPRLTSGIEVAVRSGIDFPYLLYQWANGEQVAKIEGYRTGVRMRYLEGDLLTTLQAMAQHGRPGVTPPTRALLEFSGKLFCTNGLRLL